MDFRCSRKRASLVKLNIVILRQPLGVSEMSINPELEFKGRGFSRQLGTTSDLVKTGAASTPEGAQWLTAVLDPYHDYNMQISGAPTLNPSLSFLRQYKLRRTLDKGSLTGVWDLHIFYSDVQNPTNGTRGHRIPGLVSGQAPYYTVDSAGTKTRGLITIVKCPSGTGIYDPSSLWSEMSVPYSPELATSTSRVISAGFEVHNTTSQLYMGGGCTVWKVNPVTNSEYVDVISTPPGVAPAGERWIVTNTQGVPENVALANALPTSRTWEASKGCYVVAQPNFSDMKYQTYGGGLAFLTLSTNSTGDSVYGMIQRNVPAPVTDPFLNGGFTPSGLVPSGAIFTGLSAESTFTLDCRIIVEYSPGFKQDDLALCTPTAPYDALALASAAKIFARLPPAVPVNFNGAGDWFRMILSTASKVLTPLAAFLPGPGKAIAGITAAAANAIANAIPVSGMKVNAATNRMTTNFKRPPVHPQKQKGASKK